MRIILFSLLLAARALAQEIEDPALATKLLLEGNLRFAGGIPKNKNSTERREKTVEAQTPFAVVVGCSDSRVSPEIIFDQSIGDLFVVRVAGNVVGEIELDSIEYAVTQLETPVVLVLGHQNCGAVRAVLQGRVLDEDLAAVAPHILPAVEKSANQSGDRLTNAILQNVKNVVKKLKESPVLVPYLERGTLRIMGGYYEMTSGIVTLIKEAA